MAIREMYIIIQFPPRKLIPYIVLHRSSHKTPFQHFLRVFEVRISHISFRLFKGEEKVAIYIIRPFGPSFRYHPFQKVLLNPIISVTMENELSLCYGQSTVPCAREALVLFVTDYLNVPVIAGQNGFQNRQTVVRGTVIDKDKFHVTQSLSHQALRATADEASDIVDWYYYRYFRHF